MMRHDVLNFIQIYPDVLWLFKSHIEKSSVERESVMSIQLEYTALTLCCDRPLADHEAVQLRGFFGQRYQNRPEFHHHGQQGLIYKHPLIQYKVIGGVGRILGIGAGSFLLQAVVPPKQLMLNGQALEVLEAHRVTEQCAFGPTSHLIDYRFFTPWLALNEENYAVFKHSRDPAQRNELLNRILIGNLLSLCKAVELEVEERLHAIVRMDRTEEVRIKQEIELVGIQGTFSVNFLLPPMWGIGKQSARGFGVAHRIGG
jgi:hypothetical protein